MQKILATVFACTVAVGAFAAPWSKDNLGEHINKTNIVLNGNCSATVVDLEEQLILTANHCVPEDWSKDVELRQTIYEGHEIRSVYMVKAHVVHADEDNDLALLKAEGVTLPYGMEATIYEGEVNVGEDIYVVGNPLGSLDNSVSKGIISALHRFRGEAPVWQIDAEVIGGNSGGAVYNEEGYLIGVVSAGMAARTFAGMAIPLGLNFIVPLDKIQDLVENYEEQ